MAKITNVSNKALLIQFKTKKKKIKSKETKNIKGNMKFDETCQRNAFVRTKSNEFTKEKFRKR